MIAAAIGSFSPDMEALTRGTARDGVIVPELVRQGSPLRDAIRAVPVPSPPAGYTVALCAKPRTLERRAMAAFWELASTRAETP